MPQAMRIAQIHYHLRPGGVTEVVSRLAAAFDRLGLENRILHGGPEAPGHLRPRCLHREFLGYTNANANEHRGDRIEPILRELEALERESTTPLILWAHNTSLGKNPELTEALWRWSQGDRKVGARILVLQHHDFADQGRDELWQRLQNYASERQLPFLDCLFPRGEGTHHLSLSERDRQGLLERGLPQQSVSVLPNWLPVREDGVWSPALSEETRTETHRELRYFCDQHHYHFPPESRILLYPTRCLRRKNLAEALLLKEILGPEYHLLISLDGGREIVSLYEQRLREFFNHHRLNASIGFGLHLGLRAGLAGEEAKKRLYQLSDVVLTTSIQEGFGFAFFESWLHGRLLIGRDLTALTKEYTARGMRFDSLYRKLPLRMNDVLREKLLKRRAEEDGHAGLRLVEPLPERVSRIHHRSTVDFAELPLSLQLELCVGRQWAPHLSSSFVKRMRKHVELAQDPAAVHAALIRANREVVLREFGEAGAEEKLRILLCRLGVDATVAVAPPIQLQG